MRRANLGRKGTDRVIRNILYMPLSAAAYVATVLASTNQSCEEDYDTGWSPVNLKSIGHEGESERGRPLRAASLLRSLSW